MRAQAVRVSALLRRHALMTLAVAAGAMVRLLFVAAYAKPFVIVPDSAEYLRSAQTWVPPTFRPFGYSVVLAVLEPLGDLRVVYVVQHLAGLALAVAVYAFLVRRGVRRWLAVIAAAPLLFDSMSISLEHYVMAETLFLVLVIGGTLLLMRKATPTVTVAAVAGLLLAFGGLTRTVGLPLGALALVYLVVRKAGWKACTAFVAAFAVPVVGYVFWFHSHYGVYGTAEQPELPLYGRVTQIVDCDRLQLTPQERELCPPEPLGQRHAPDWYWLGRVPDPPNPAISTFNAKVLREQPLDLVVRWAIDTSFFFRQAMPRDREECLRYVWVPMNRPRDTGCYPAEAANTSFYPWAEDSWGSPAPAPSSGLADLVRDYAAETRTPPLLLIIELIIVVVGAVRWRRRPRFAGDDGRDAVMAAVTGFALLGLSVAGSMYDLRYSLPALPLFGVGAALAANLLLDKKEAKAAAVIEPGSSPSDRSPAGASA